MFGPRKRIRHVAAHVLLVWLFALGVGIVNACVLEPDLRHGLAASAPDGHGHAVPLDSHEGHVAGVHDHSAPQGGKLPCVKFCDEPSFGAQTVKQQIDPFSSVSPGPVPSGSMVVEQVPVAVRPQATDPTRWRPAIPISIAFLRLTL